MRVGDMCRRDVETVRSDATALVAARRMRAQETDALVVVNDGGQPIGLLSNRDVVRGLVAQERDPVRTTVAELMTMPRPVRECWAIETALRCMLTSASRRLAVVDEKGALRGLVTFDDLVNVVAGDVSLIGAVLERTSKRRAA
jgi:CBS domain-containing protein